MQKSTFKVSELYRCDSSEEQDQPAPSLTVYGFPCSPGVYEGESISNQPNLFPVEIHLFFFDVVAL